MQTKKSALGAVAALTIAIFAISAFLISSEISWQYKKHISAFKDSGWMFTDLERKLNALDAAYRNFKDTPTADNHAELVHALNSFDGQLTATLEVSKNNPVLHDPVVGNFTARIRDIQHDFREDIKNFDLKNKEESAHLDEHMVFLKNAIEGITTKILTNDFTLINADTPRPDDTRLILLFVMMATSGAGLIAFLMQHAVRSQKLAQEALNNESLLRNRLAAIEAASDGIGIVDREGRLLYMNAALARLHAIDNPAEYLGKSMRALYTPKGQAALDNEVFPFLLKHGSWRGESPVVQTTGNIIHTELSLTLLPDGSMIGTARDITDRKKAEAEQKSLQEQFYQAQKMEALGRLAGGIAHDFNNILAAIVGYAEFLTEDLEKDSEQNRFASRILKASHKAQDLVDQILAFSRKSRVVRERIDLAETLNEIASLLDPLLPQTVALHKKIDAHDMNVLANNSQINQVLMNLCVNAIDAMEGAQGKLEISLNTPGKAEMENLCISDGGGAKKDAVPLRITDCGQDAARLIAGRANPGMRYCCISIRDTGTGISRDLMEKIFEPFFTTKDVGKGTGLGLSAVLGIIAAHEGCLVLESKIGAGSRFCIYLPVAEKDTGYSENEKNMHKPLGTETILIVDDEADVGDMLTNAFERLGYNAVYCGSGHEAVEQISENPGHFQIVITDYSMPGMNGLEMANLIHDADKNLPVIVLSGFSGRNIEEFLSFPGVRAAFKKPVNVAEVSQALRALLDERNKSAK